MIPQHLLPTNLLENSLNILEGQEGNIMSPLSPINASSKLKKQYRKRKSSEKDLKKATPINSSSARAKGRKSQQLKKHQNRNRRRSIDSEGGGDVDASTDEEEVNSTIEETAPDASQQLRSWFDQYEEAVTNHYSPELRARLAGVGKWGGISNGELRPSVIGSLTRCNVSLQGNGVKILTAANSSLSSNTPVIECKGKLMLAAQYRSGNRKVPGQNDSSNIPVNPYVFFYQLSDSLEICLDGKTYGNDSRFCRRSSNDYNAELRHVIDKGSLHLFIITLKTVEKNQEILLPPDRSCRPQESSPLPSINADLREITMKSSKPVTNGALTPATSPISPRSSDLDESTPLSSTRNKQNEDISKPESGNRQNNKTQKEISQKYKVKNTKSKMSKSQKVKK
jgi:histone-lysine N-methyltransferase MLL5